MKECRVEEEYQSVPVERKYNRFYVWEGRDFWHKDTDVQVRLDDDRVYLSVTRKGKPMGSGYVSLEKLGDALADLLEKHGRKS